MNLHKLLINITDWGAATVRRFGIGLFALTTLVLVLDLMGVATGLGVIGYIGCYAISAGLFWLGIRMQVIVYDNKETQPNDDAFTRR